MDIELGTRYDPGSIEESIYRFWERGKHFHTEPDRPGDPYTIVIPPPNVTGALHMGHALNNTLQDILARWKRMKGFNVCWMPGMDHAGIATQNVVERQLADEGLTREELGREGPLPCYIEVNVGGEAQKQGVTPEQLSTLLSSLAGYTQLAVVGLMTVAPRVPDAEQVRPVFRELRALARANGLDGLSMGMTEDYGVAIEEGATVVRVGRAIFGERLT